MPLCLLSSLLMTLCLLSSLVARMQVTLRDLDRSYPGFNAIKFLHVYDEAAPPEAAPAEGISLQAVVAAGSSRTHLPVKYSMTGGGKLNQDRVLYNDIVDLCRKYGRYVLRRCSICQGP